MTVSLAPPGTQKRSVKKPSEGLHPGQLIPVQGLTSMPRGSQSEELCNSATARPSASDGSLSPT